MADPQKRNSSVNVKEKDPLQGISSVFMILFLKCKEFL